MVRTELISLFLQLRILSRWHWFTYHFQWCLNGSEHPFARSIVDACLDVDSRIDGFATEFVKRFASLGADEKFKPFQKRGGRSYGCLVIVWDDHIYEPISALLGPAAGLFTANSFAKRPDGSPEPFSAVDGVVIVRHLHTFARAAADRPLAEHQHALDYGEDGVYPHKAYIKNPRGKGLPELLVKCLQGYTPGPELGAEYVPSDLVWWFTPRGKR